MTVWIGISAIAVAALTILGLGGMVLARLNGYRRAGSKAARQLGFTSSDAGFTMARYEPLNRLLACDDMEFLRRQRTCPKIAARWKRARIRIVRLYLRDLAADFRCLHAQARALVANSPEQHSELVAVLIRQQVTFWRVMAEAELRLTLSWLGVRLDAPRLAQSIAAMQAEIALTVAPVPA